MKTRLVYGRDAEIAEWVSKKIGEPNFGQCTAIGVELDGGIIAGVVYSNYVEHKGNPISVEISCASVDKKWCTRYNLRALYTYPFRQLRVPRAQVSIPVESKGVVKFNEKLGFKYEGTGRKAHFLGGDMVVLSMLRDECRWIKGG
jgi:RimJ/RimL family protein N-acetyltransferase